MTKKAHVRLSAFDVLAATVEYKKVSSWLAALKDAYDTSDSAKAWQVAFGQFDSAPAEAEKTMQGILQHGYSLVAQEVLAMVNTNPAEAEKVLNEMLQNFYGLLAQEKLGSTAAQLRAQLDLAKDAGMSRKDLASFRKWLNAAEAEMKAVRLSMSLKTWVGELDNLTVILDRAGEQLGKFIADATLRTKLEAARALFNTPVETSTPVAGTPVPAAAPVEQAPATEPEPVAAPVDEIPVPAPEKSRKKRSKKADAAENAANDEKPAGKMPRKRTRKQAEIEGDEE